MANLSDLLGGAVSNVEDVETVTSSSSDPAVDSNPSATGHIWINTTSGEVYVCTDITSGSNVWTNMGDGGGLIEPLWYGDRGITAGGYNNGNLSTIQYVTISTTGNANGFGSLTSARKEFGGLGGGGRGVFAGPSNEMDYITISTTSNAVNFGNLSEDRESTCGISNAFRGVFAGGKTITIDYITISTTSNAVNFGNLTSNREASGCNAGNETRGIVAGGKDNWGNVKNIIDYITIASTGNATDFGDLTLARSNLTGCSSETRTLFAGGRYSGSSYSNVIEYVTTSSLGNGTDFGDLYGNRESLVGTSNSVRGLFSGGGVYPTPDIGSDTAIDYVTIATTSNATDFGNLSTGTGSQPAGCSGD